MLRRIELILKKARVAKTRRQRVLLVYCVSFMLVVVSHILSWMSQGGLVISLGHGIIGCVMIFLSLATMLDPVLNLFRVTSTMNTITKDRSEVHQLHLRLIEKGNKLVGSIRGLKEVLEGTLDALLQEHEAVIRDPVKTALSDVSLQMEGAEGLTDIARKLESAVRDEIKQMRDREMKTSSYLRTEAQVQMVNNFWSELHGFVFLTVGFGFLYYSLWAVLSRYGLAMFSMPAGMSLSLSDFLYYSVVTVSMLGYGEISPLIWPAQFLVVVQVAIGATFVVGIIGVLLSLLTSEEFYKRRIFQASGGKRPDDYTDDLEKWNVRMGTTSGKLSEEFSEKLEQLSAEFNNIWTKHQKTFREIGLL